MNEGDLVNSARYGVFPHRARMRYRCRPVESTAIEAGHELDWRGDLLVNVRAISSFILAVALMALTAGLYPAEQSGQGTPYTGPDTPVTTSA